MNWETGKNMTTRKETILIVDDTPTNIKILVEALQVDYTILVATNGKDAIKLAGSDPCPDIILLDILMPRPNGYDVCATLKNDSKTSGIPIIFVTALGSEEDETKGLKAGAVDFITKPYSIPIVKARIRIHLRLKEVEKNQEKLIGELKDALSRIKTLNGLLPICVQCKKIRDDKGYWNQIESYVSRHSLAEFSHGLCPDCVKLLYPDFKL
jgi:response regulator RpfG family c-di-GMP phosphodiesterase